MPPERARRSAIRSTRSAGASSWSSATSSSVTSSTARTTSVSRPLDFARVEARLLRGRAALRGGALARRRTLLRGCRARLRSRPAATACLVLDLVREAAQLIDRAAHELPRVVAGLGDRTSGSLAQSAVAQPLEQIVVQRRLGHVLLLFGYRAIGSSTGDALPLRCGVIADLRRDVFVRARLARIDLEPHVGRPLEGAPAVGQLLDQVQAPAADARQVPVALDRGEADALVDDLRADARRARS